jgi:Holliday junction resolvasome RuvABC endonuclease subunit
MGVDPGCNGAATLMQLDGQILGVIEFNKNTEHEISEQIAEFASDIKLAYLEKVHAGIFGGKKTKCKMGSVSAFKFGDGNGFLRGVVTAHKIPYEMVTPNEWQKSLGCQSKGDKNVTKSKAQQLFPAMTITHSKADSILIAEYCRRIMVNRVL